MKKISTDLFGIAPEECNMHSTYSNGQPMSRAAGRPIHLILACVAMLVAAGLAYAVTPHRLMARTRATFDVNAHIPQQFGDWSPLPGFVGIVRPPPGGLEAALYNQEASRAYVDKEGHVVMLMVAYGESQTERLHLHHPEICYTAAGFHITHQFTTPFHWSASAPPIVFTRLIATREDRIEPISYWMRIGYDTTSTRFDRYLLKLEYGLRGWIPDGVLIRVSTVGIQPEMSFKIQDKFIRDLLNAAPPDTRTFMVGDPAKALHRYRAQTTTRSGRQTHSSG
jgi:EpsI family protein